MSQTESYTVEPDERGESETYEGFNLVCRNATGDMMWVEGIRKDRSTMYPYWNAIIEPALQRLKESR